MRNSYLNISLNSSSLNRLNACVLDFTATEFNVFYMNSADYNFPGKYKEYEEIMMNAIRFIFN